MMAWMSSICSDWPKDGMRPGEPVAIRLIRKSSSWASSINWGQRPSLRPPLAWHHPQPLAMKATEPRSIWAALSLAAGGGVCSAARAGTELQPYAVTKKAKPAIRQRPIRRFIISPIETAHLDGVPARRGFRLAGTVAQGKRQSPGPGSIGTEALTGLFE